MYGIFLFGHLSEDVEILNFMWESVSKDEKLEGSRGFSKGL